MPISINNTTLTFNNGTTMTTAATGTVSSVATGNGLQGGTITTSGTLSVACPGWNTVGSYTIGRMQIPYSGSVSAGSNYSAGSSNYQLRSQVQVLNEDGSQSWEAENQLSGTWKWMSATRGVGLQNASVAGQICRVS